MRLLVIRHAIAENRVEFARTGQDDSVRPLTDVGRGRMKQAAEGLKAVTPSIDVLATSPLTRAAQTAEIVGNAYGGMEVVRVRALEPGAGPEAVLRWLRRQRARDTVAIVGHEPDLSVLVSTLLAETPDSFVDLKKGSACLVEFNGRANLGTGLLRWLLAPRQLRRIGAGGA